MSLPLRRKSRSRVVADAFLPGGVRNGNHHSCGAVTNLGFHNQSLITMVTKNLFSLAAVSAKCLCLVAALATAFSLASCSSDDDDEGIETEEATIEEGEDITQVVSSSETASFVRAGFSITIPYGAVPKNSDGEDGKVAFSVTRIDDMPAELPSGTNIANNASIKLEPMNFIFSSPLTIIVPSQGCEMSKVALLRFNDYSEDWDVVPFSTLNTGGTASASILELGYFVLVEYEDELSFGGMHVASDYLSSNYYYYLTLTSSEATETSTAETTKRISFAPNDEDLYMTNIPLGTYDVTITRELRSSLATESSSLEYCELGEVTISEPLEANGDSYSDYSGWKEISLQNVDWTSGRPDAWGEETVTYGTGFFQATLTWVNATGSTTDYDLHLYGPDIHVYYSNKSDGAFELDRDWLHEVGNATENLYSVSDEISAGDYEVKVRHYSGVTGKRYNCRVIMDGVVVTSVTGSISQNGQYDDIYSFTVE